MDAGVGVTVGKKLTALVGVKTRTLVGDAVKEIDGVGVTSLVAVVVGVDVTAVVAVTVAVGCPIRGPMRAGWGATGGGVKGNDEGRASDWLAQFTSKKSRRVSSARRPKIVRDNIT
jgi:hypothetical protein